MDGNENARELAEGMEAEEAGGTAPEGAGQGHAASDRPSFEDAKNGNLTPEQQEELSKAAAETFNSMQPIFESAFTPFNDMMNRMRYATPSHDFDPERHPGVCERFREWFYTSPLTLGESGRHTYSRLAELMGTSRAVAKGYVEHPETIKEWPALALRISTCPDGRDEHIYYEIVHGWGTYDEHVAALEKEAAIKEATEFMRGKDAEEVGYLVTMLKQNAETYEKFISSRPKTGIH